VILTALKRTIIVLTDAQVVLRHVKVYVNHV
jgi:hypothetical protein